MVRPLAMQLKGEDDAWQGKIIVAAVAAAVLTGPAWAQEAAIFSDMDRLHPVWAKNGMVTSQEAVATRTGLEVLREGGNAIDAAAAVAFALAVTLPRAGNLGGGGFMLIHDAKSGETVALDYRETAPASATRDQFLGPNGEPDENLSRYHGLAVGVPGTVAGMAMALERYGTMSLKDALQPAIRLAEDGITVTADLSDSLKGLEDRLKKWPSSAKIFLKEDGSPYEPGDTLKQPDLAQSLKEIADKGPAAFYGGPIGEKIVQAVNDAGGEMTIDDLKGYEAKVREPVTGTYRGYDILSMPPPSSGGIHIVQILNILEDYPIGFLGQNSAETIHLMAEAMKRAYADRSEYLGDSDFVDVPIEALTSKDYAAAIRDEISANRATPSASIKPGDLAPYESNETTHFSIVDKDGNAIANTYTINFSYGTGYVAPGTGILLNNELDDFSAKPGEPNAYGLIGGEANAVQPKKRPLSSMSPTIVMQNGEPYLVTGSPGGSRIITTTLQVIMNMIDHGLNVATATAAPRVHHQWLPDEIRIEEGISPDTQALLEAKGHTLNLDETMGSTQSIHVDREEGVLLGSADPRRAGALAAGY